MEIIKQKDQCYEMTEEQYFTVQDAVYSILNLVKVMEGYCEYHIEDVKEITPLLTSVAKIKGEGKRITDLF